MLLADLLSSILSKVETEGKILGVKISRIVHRYRISCTQMISSFIARRIRMRQLELKHVLIDIVLGRDKGSIGRNKKSTLVLMF